MIPYSLVIVLKQTPTKFLFENFHANCGKVVRNFLNFKTKKQG